MKGATIAEGRALARRRIVVHGAVQGVGFRPFVHREAVRLGLSGWVGNSCQGVLIEAEGPPDALDALIDRLREAPPPNARISSVEVDDLNAHGETGFRVRHSIAGAPDGIQILPDLATCDACLAELFDPADRRHRYPFVNCTRCGPRYSIIEDVPYDRSRTSMRHFPMCPACRREYEDPGDRRFHAEPIACPDCGPHLRLLDGTGTRIAEADAALGAAAEAVRDGSIVAVKGIGGFHLFVDADDDAAVARLRARKRRPDKPFAVMFPTIESLRDACVVDATAEALLTGTAQPIVLLRGRGNALATSVAPGNPRLGAFLPYSPLHHLLMAEIGRPVVATSGNLGGEPIVTDNAEAVSRLDGIADLFLVHDRPILRPVDDSVVQIVRGETQVLRRARGYAPSPVSAGGTAPGVVGYGGHMKAAVALSHPAGIVISQHIGDLDTRRARHSYARTFDDLVHLHGTKPQVAAHDLHPDHASTMAAERSGIRPLPVQHHVAHVAACLAENGHAPPALGVAWDGSGTGPDGTVWGGEFLVLDDTGWRRIAALRPFRLPGGEAAVREPRRAALGLLYAAFGDDCFGMSDLPPIADFTAEELGVLRTMLRTGRNAPLTSSMGRLFDAIAALLGLCERASYEGQAAAALEWSADCTEGVRPCGFPLHHTEGADPARLDWQPALEAVLSDLRTGDMTANTALAFHAGLANAVVEVARFAGQPRVALTGGCFQNVRLTEATVAALSAAGFEAIWHRQVPPNDGGLAFGQVAWASWRDRQGDR